MLGNNITLASLCQFGHTKIFIRKQLSQSLEALREIKLEDMKRSAVLVQSVARMYFAKNRIERFFGGFLRLQAAWRSVFYRQQWLRRRNGILTVQWFLRGLHVRNTYKRHLNAAKVINRFIKLTLQRVEWLRLRRGLRVLHSLSRGFVIRMHVVKMIAAVRTLQTMARTFLKRTRKYWDKVKGALLFQAAWRGYKSRVEREDIVDYLALKREERQNIFASRTIQGAWKTTLIKRRYKQIKMAAGTLQDWSRSSQIRSRFLLVRRCALTIQRIGRGAIARANVRDRHTATMIADELWRIKTIRERELLHIAKMNSNPNKLSQIGFKEGFTAAAYAKKNRGRVQYRFACLDIDTMVDDSEVYPRGVGPVLYDLMYELAPNNRRIQAVEAGANHMLALDSAGEVYTWGFGDRGQLGHANFRSKIRPEKMSATAFSSATGELPGKNGSGRVQFRYSTGSPYSGTVRNSIGRRISIRQIGCGEDHSVALTEGGIVFTWGDNSRGQLGHGDGSIQNGTRMNGLLEDCPSPRMVKGIMRRKVAEISVGGHHTMALVVAGSLYTWGSGEQLGLGVFQGNGDQSSPQPVKFFNKFRLRHIDCGVDWSCALTHSGDVYTWGNNHNGQLGTGDGRRRLVPNVLKYLRRGGEKHARIVDIACGGHHAVCVSSTGRVHVWGRNNHGQLGLGDLDDRSSPQMLHRLRKVRIMQVGAGWRHSIVLTDEQQMYAFGMFSAVKHVYPRNMHDPDADNTQFESHIPLEVPFNAVTSSTTQQPTGTHHHHRSEPTMPSLRTIQGISCTNSRSISITTIQWQQKPGPISMLRQPLLHHSLTVQTKEADNLLLDHKQHEPGYAKNLEQAQKERESNRGGSSGRRGSVGVRSIEEREAKGRSSRFNHAASIMKASDLIGLTDQELMMSLPVTPMKSGKSSGKSRTRSIHGHYYTTTAKNNSFASSSQEYYTDLDPHGITPVELQKLDTEQLRQLVLKLQKTPADFSGGFGSSGNGGYKSHSRIGMNYGLRVNAESSPIIQSNRRELKKERTLMEQQARFKFRDLPEDELTPIQEAQRRAWNGYHGSKLKNSKKKNLQLGVNAPDHRGRMTSPERKYSMEHHLRAELLEFNENKASRQSRNSKDLGSPSLPPPKQTVDILPTTSLIEDIQFNPRYDEKRWEARVQREGQMSSNGLMDLFTPEQLVATSNDGKLKKLNNFV
jgi:alpha-tubulin suppressor-like RCC1 family protein